MSELKLAKLPDRKPVKIAITVSPNLNKKLDAYADAYKGAYGDAEKVSDLIPFMLEQFLDGDRSFRGARRRRTSDASDRTN
ncbi:MAG: transposase [Alphaproteobacteria bacterium 65-7]|nr:MAG: transposase [Alphaproteobacteria bacterium 65-7]